MPGFLVCDGEEALPKGKVRVRSSADAVAGNCPQAYAIRTEWTLRVVRSEKRSWVGAFIASDLGNGRFFQERTISRQCVKDSLGSGD